MKQRITRYCKVCESRVEDNTVNNNKILCSPDCQKKYRTMLRDAERKKRKPRDEIEIPAGEKLPKWRCEKGHEMQLDFYPLARRMTEKIRSIKCPQCP